MPGSHKQKRLDQPLKKPNSTEKRQIHAKYKTTPSKHLNAHILYMKKIKLTPLINFSKLLSLLKSNLKLQIYKHETTKQKIIYSYAEFSFL